MPETVVWIDPEGAITTFSRVEFDLSGRWFPSLVLDEDPLPGQPGSRLNEVRHGPLEFTMPVWVRTASETALRTALRAVVYALDPSRGVGTVRVTAPGGDLRELPCVCVDGLPMVERLGQTSNTVDQKLVLAFRAHSPYWTAASDTVQDFTLGTQPTFFNGPWFPLRLASSEILVDTSVSNDGDVESWPVWTITGPGSGIVLQNLTSGKDLAFSAQGGLVLGSGESVVVDTRPGYKTLTKGDGGNAWPHVAATSALWSLSRGGNAIRLQMAGSTTASGLRVSHRPRYLSP